MTPPAVMRRAALTGSGVASANIDREHAIDEVVVGIDGRTRSREDSGVVDPDVEPAERVDGQVGGCGQRRRVGDVQRHRDAPADLGQLGVQDRRRPQRLCRRQRPLAPGFHQADHLRTKTAGGPGDDSTPAFEGR